MVRGESSKDVREFQMRVRDVGRSAFDQVPHGAVAAALPQASNVKSRDRHSDLPDRVRHRVALASLQHTDVHVDSTAPQLAARRQKHPFRPTMSERVDEMKDAHRGGLFYGPER
jgi:hypothetical protein